MIEVVAKGKVTVGIFVTAGEIVCEWLVGIPCSWQLNSKTLVQRQIAASVVSLVFMVCCFGV